ncbi:unnamed protein product [Brassica rapa]|uniref:Uncharacterized protein n=1 Tax=Brassica campestris TaxID=3711 RepID=A0A8D9H700_BRACM|nr:unnamed protein product [Brassica rapa]
MSRCGVKPRPHWITTEFGGKGAHHADGSQSSYERRPGVAERAEEARGGHYIKVDQLIPPKTRCDCLGSSHSSSLRSIFFCINRFQILMWCISNLHTWVLHNHLKVQNIHT